MLRINRNEVKTAGALLTYAEWWGVLFSKKLKRSHYSYRSIYLSIDVDVFITVRIYSSIYRFVCLSVSICSCLSILKSVSLFFSLSLSLYIYIYIYIYISPFRLELSNISTGSLQMGETPTTSVQNGTLSRIRLGEYSPTHVSVYLLYINACAQHRICNFHPPPPKKSWLS